MGGYSSEKAGDRSRQAGDPSGGRGSSSAASGSAHQSQGQSQPSQASSNQQNSISLTGQGTADEPPRRPGDIQRRQSSDCADASRKAQAGRSNSLPRHVGLEYRPTVMPPSTGR